MRHGEMRLRKLYTNSGELSRDNYYSGFNYQTISTHRERDAENAIREIRSANQFQISPVIDIRLPHKITVHGSPFDLDFNETDT